MGKGRLMGYHLTLCFERFCEQCLTITLPFKSLLSIFLSIFKILHGKQFSRYAPLDLQIYLFINCNVTYKYEYAINHFSFIIDYMCGTFYTPVHQSLHVWRKIYVHYWLFQVGKWFNLQGQYSHPVGLSPSVHRSKQPVFLSRVSLKAGVEQQKLNASLFPISIKG